MIGDTKPKSQEEKRLDAMGGGSGGVGEFVNDEQNSERFNDYTNNSSTGQYNHVEGRHNSAAPPTGSAATYSSVHHIEGDYNETTGYCNHVEGQGNHCDGSYCHVEGQAHTVSGTYNHVDGDNHTVGGSMNSVSCNYNNVTGSYNIVGGASHTVTGSWCTVGGQRNTVAGIRNVVSGESNSTGSSSFNNLVGGTTNEVTGDSNVVCGEDNKSYSVRSCIVGRNNTNASNETVVAGDHNTNSGSGSVVAGQRNTNTGTNALVVGQDNTNQRSGAIMCGTGGTNVDHFISVTFSNAEVFYVGYNGACYAAGGYTSPSADYAEYFEWADGNPENEDRRGMLVQLVGDKIAPAHGDDILGIVSACPSVVGNAYPEHWHGRYKRDIFGAYILDENGEKQLSEDYDKDREYIPRSQRQEWAAVGLLGQLVIRDNGKCQPGGYVEARQGIGVPTFTETKIRCMKRLDDNHCLVYVGR